MIINYFKSKSDLLEEIDILKTKLLINKNLVGRFEDCYESKKLFQQKPLGNLLKT